MIAKKSHAYSNLNNRIEEIHGFELEMRPRTRLIGHVDRLMPNQASP